MANFEDIINEWVENTETKINEILQTITIQIGTSLIRLSPVDSGRFKGNWQLSIESGSNSSLTRLDPSGSAAIQELASKANLFTAGQVAYIQNHVEYGYDLEYGTYNGPTQKVTEEGFSTQAPRGMLRITAARFTQIVNDAIRLHSS